MKHRWKRVAQARPVADIYVDVTAHTAPSRSNPTRDAPTGHQTVTMRLRWDDGSEFVMVAEDPKMRTVRR